jgi:hypothetical protein
LRVRLAACPGAGTGGRQAADALGEGRRRRHLPGVGRGRRRWRVGGRHHAGAGAKTTQAILEAGHGSVAAIQIEIEIEIGIMVERALVRE